MAEEVPLIIGHRQRSTLTALKLVLKPGEMGINEATKELWIRGYDDEYFPVSRSIDVRAFGALADGSDDTAAFNAAYAVAVAGGGELYIPPGEYYVNVTFTAEAPVRGAGIRRTILRPYSEASPCVKLYGSGGDSMLGASLSYLSIYGQETLGVYNQNGTGLECGSSAGDGLSHGNIEKLDVRGFEYNILIKSAIACNFRQIWSADGIYGLEFNSEGNITTCGFDGFRVATCDYGIRMRSGMICTFTNTVSESSTYRNLWLETYTTTGPSKLIFDNCWFEDITGGSGSRSGIFLEMEPTISATKGMDVLFNRCIVSTPNGIADVHAEKAQNVVFDTCVFSATADAFSTTKFTFATGDDSVRVWLKNCGTIQALPSTTLYASFPSLYRSTGGAFGYFYEFTQRNGKRYTNFEDYTVAADVTSLQAAYLKNVAIDTTLNNRFIESFVGGYNYQRIRITKPVSANQLTIVNNGSGTEKLFTRSGSNILMTGRRSVEFFHYGGAWFEDGCDPGTISNALSIIGALTVTWNSTSTVPTIEAKGEVPRYGLRYEGSGSAADQNYWERSAGSNEMVERTRADDGTEGPTYVSYKRPSGNAVVAVQFERRVGGSKGVSVAAANDLTLGTDGNAFTITGNTQINGIETANWHGAPEIILIFSGTPTVKHNTAAGAGFARIFLSGSADLVASANTVLKLVYDGTQWQEVSRKVP